MRDYGFSDFGIVLEEGEVIEFTRKYLKKNDTDRYNDIFFDGDIELSEDDVNVYDCLEAVDNYIFYVTEFTGEADLIYDCGTVSFESVRDYSDETMFYIPLIKCPNLFSKAYESFNDMVQKHKDEYAEYLPDDFNWNKRFAQIVGTYFG